MVTTTMWGRYLISRGVPGCSSMTMLRAVHAGGRSDLWPPIGVPSHLSAAPRATGSEAAPAWTVFLQRRRDRPRPLALRLVGDDRRLGLERQPDVVEPAQEPTRSEERRV